MRVHDDVLAIAGREPDRVALRCGKQCLTYSDLAARIERLAATMAGSLTPGDRVVMLLSDKPWFLAGFYAISLSGAVAVPLAEGAAPRTLDEIMDHCEPSVLLTTGKELARFPDLLAQRSIAVLDVEALDGGTAPGSSEIGRAHV